MVWTFVGSTKKVLVMVQVTITMEPSWKIIQRSLLLNYNLGVIISLVIIILHGCNLWFPSLQLLCECGCLSCQFEKWIISSLRPFHVCEGKKQKKSRFPQQLWRNAHIGRAILILCLHSKFLPKMFVSSCFKALFSLC
jgi:hypothetical protein